MLSVQRVAKSYGGTAALAGVSLEAPPATYLVLLGPSGSGKTTLLSILGGFASADAGSVRLDGEDVTHAPPARRPTATVFQDYALFPHMRVAGNVGFGLRMRGLRGAELAREVEAALALVGLEGFGRRRIDELSGGQRQRVALARALVIRPKLLLLDEPLGALDLALRGRMQEELKRLQRRTGAVFVHVTHDQDEAMGLGDAVAVLRAGRIEDHGPPERLYLRPATPFAAAFMGEGNLLPARAEGAGVATPLGPLVAEEVPPVGATALQAMIRPEHLRRAPPGGDGPNRFRARVQTVAFQGDHLRCRVAPEAAPDMALTAKLPADDPAAVGAEIELEVPPRHVVLLPAG